MKGDAEQHHLVLIRKIYGRLLVEQTASNGKITTYSRYGIIEMGTVSNIIDEDTKKIYLKLFGGK